MVQLGPLGWDENWQAAFLAVSEKGSVPARVVGEERGYYRLLLSPESEPVLAEISGKLRHAAVERRDYPAVGDWVACRKSGDRAVVLALLQRRTCLVRKEAGESLREQILATNVDTALLVTSANQDLNPRRLERYLTLVRESGARPVILLNKIDLVPQWPKLQTELESVAAGLPILPISAKAGIGLEQLDSYLSPGSTSVLLGSSGVGKSTLTNFILGHQALKTENVREHDDRGKHTTTSRYLFMLPNGPGGARGMLIDTPGLRELQLTTEQEEGLQASFQEIEDLSRRCKFSNCRHESEPGCAITGALAAGTLTRERWDAFLKLEAEIAAKQKKKGRGKPRR